MMLSLAAGADARNGCLSGLHHGIMDRGTHFSIFGEVGFERFGIVLEA